jgi:hypothetical protein
MMAVVRWPENDHRAIAIVANIRARWSLIIHKAIRHAIWFSTFCVWVLRAMFSVSVYSEECYDNTADKLIRPFKIRE